MLLNDRARIILFWLTIALMLVVAILAAATILRACGGLPTEREPAPAITPPEVSLCPGDEQQFAVGGDDEVDWDATGGSIGQAGVFTAGDSPGDYTVTATRDDSGQAAGAIVHIIACTPTPTATPFPTALPTITPTAPPAPTTTPSDSPDPGGDIGAYETGAPVDPQPSGVDIRAASISPDLSVGFQTTQDSPAELSDWTEEGEILLWISLHQAIPDPPTAYMNWLFVLDVDADTETGRPLGSRRINPDIGDEVAIGISYNTDTAAYEPYALVWSTDDGQWATGPDVRYTFGESRTVVGLAVPLEGLENALSKTASVTLTPEDVKGRGAAETYVNGERAIDFYPDLPE